MLPTQMPFIFVIFFPDTGQCCQPAQKNSPENQKSDHARITPISWYRLRHNTQEKQYQPTDISLFGSTTFWNMYENFWKLFFASSDSLVSVKYEFQPNCVGQENLNYIFLCFKEIESTGNFAFWHTLNFLANFLPCNFSISHVIFKYLFIRTFNNNILWIV